MFDEHKDIKIAEEEFNILFPINGRGAEAFPEFFNSFTKAYHSEKMKISAKIKTSQESATEFSLFMVERLSLVNSFIHMYLPVLARLERTPKEYRTGEYQKAYERELKRKEENFGEFLGFLISILHYGMLSPLFKPELGSKSGRTAGEQFLQQLEVFVEEMRGLGIKMNFKLISNRLDYLPHFGFDKNKSAFYARLKQILG